MNERGKETLEVFKDQIYELSGHEYVYKVFYDLFEIYRTQPLSISLSELISLIDSRLGYIVTGRDSLKDYGDYLHSLSHEIQLRIDNNDENIGIDESRPAIFSISFTEVIDMLDGQYKYLDLFTLFYYVYKRKECLESNQTDQNWKVEVVEHIYDFKDELRNYLMTHGYNTVAYAKIDRDVHQSILRALPNESTSLNIKLHYHEANALIYLVARSVGETHEDISKWLPHVAHEFFKRGELINTDLKSEVSKENLEHILNAFEVLKEIKCTGKDPALQTCRNYLKSTSGASRFLGYMQMKGVNYFNDVKLGNLRNYASELLPSNSEHIVHEIDKFDRDPIHYLNSKNEYLFLRVSESTEK